MWRRVEVRNFRSIEFAAVDLAPFTVVVGPNGSGKSNFADAFVFARDVVSGGAAAVQNRGGIAAVRRWRPHGAADITLDIRMAPAQNELDSSYRRHRFTLRSGRGGEWKFSREEMEIVQRGKRSFGAVRTGDDVDLDPPLIPPVPSTAGAAKRIDRIGLEIAGNTSALPFLLPQARQLAGLGKVRRFRLNPDVMRQPQIATERTRLDENGSNIAEVLQALRERADWDTVLATMARIIPGLKDIDVGTLGRYWVMRFFQEQPGGQTAEFAAADMSEGAIRALGVVVAASQMRVDELLIIEEPEVSIHPGAAQLLFEILKDASRRGAVLVTTHSADLLDAASTEEVLVCEYTDGTTRVGPLASSQRELVRKGLLTVAELMRSEPLRIEGRPSPTIQPATVEP